MKQEWENRFLDYFVGTEHDQSDASHDLAHFKRVAYMAEQIADLEEFPVDRLVLMASAYFHDIVSLPKNHPESKLSSKYAAEKTQEILRSMSFPNEKIPHVFHAIHAHSFSAQVTPETMEAKIIQDSDRMESLGALGIMRTFYVCGRLGLKPYHEEDLFAKQRPLNDKQYALDHFYCKLFKLPEMLQTKGGRQMALGRTGFMQDFVDELVSDLQSTGQGGALFIVKACIEAGEHGHKLCDAADPFAVQRRIGSSQNVLDKLMENAKNFAYVSKFISQFKREIVL